MRLSDVASYFDHTLCVDAFNPLVWFKGQLDLFDDSRRDGLSAVRRILSVRDGISVPPRRIVMISGQPWLVGDNQPDSYWGSVIRRKYTLHAAVPAKVRTAMDILADAAPAADTFAARAWYKDTKDVLTTSELQSQYLVYFAKTEAVRQGFYVQFDTTLLLIRNLYPSVAGFLVGEAVELEPDCVKDASYTARTGSWDAVNEVDTGAVAVPVKVIVSTFLTDYDHRGESNIPVLAGDMRFRLLKTAIQAPAPGDQLAVSGEQWVVLGTAERDFNSWTLHVRRA